MGRQQSSQHTSTTAISKLRGDIQRLLDASLTKSSLASYSHAWTVFKDFAEKYDLIIEFPVKQHILVYYVAYLFSKDYAATTISSYLSAISYIHKLNSFGDPCSSFLIQKLLLSTRKHANLNLHKMLEYLLLKIFCIKFVTFYQLQF